MLLPLLVSRKIVVIVTTISLAILLIYIQYSLILAWCVAAFIEKPSYYKLNTKSADAIVVLGSGFYVKNQVAYPDEESLQRLIIAYKLAQQFPNTPIVLSGGGESNNLSFTTASGMANYLRYNLDYKGKILLETRSQNTAEEAFFIKKQYPELKRIILVTQAYHMWRSKMLFEKYAALIVYPYTEPYFAKYNFSVSQIITPAFNNLNFSQLYLHEIIGYLRGLTY